jgi:alkylation response protein AidB-like acyl-CoA dehydrogenase
VRVAELTDVVDGVRRVAGGVARDDAARVDRERAFPRATIDALGAEGALGLLIPAEAGGAGGSLTALAESCEALGAACASSAMVFLMHSVAAATVAAGGGDAAAETLASMASGATLGTLAFSERGTGAHFHAPELRAVAHDGGLVVNGSKSFVTSGGEAGAYLVLLQAGGDGASEIYLLDAGQRGMRFDGAWGGLGLAGNSSIAMTLEDVVVGAERRIGGPGAGGELVFGAVAPVFLVGLAAVNVGIARAALDAATEHVVGRRYADGSTLAEVQVTQHGLAEMDGAVRAAHLVVADAARLGEAGDPGALVPIMEAKVRASETAAAVTQTALELTGGQGYTSALPIERHLRDARAGAVMAPTNGVLKTWIGRALAGLPVP